MDERKRSQRGKDAKGTKRGPTQEKESRIEIEQIEGNISLNLFRGKNITIPGIYITIGYKGTDRSRAGPRRGWPR